MNASMLRDVLERHMKGVSVSVRSSGHTHSTVGWHLRRPATTTPCVLPTLVRSVLAPTSSGRRHALAQWAASVDLHIRRERESQRARRKGKPDSSQGKRLEAGMTSINDFCSTYMSQDLPFGGVKDSGFGRFAGVEGLRGICVPKAVSEDIAPWLLNTTIPGPLQYPVKPAAFPLVQGLCRLFFGTGPGDFTRALANIASAFVFPPRSQTKAV